MDGLSHTNATTVGDHPERIEFDRRVTNGGGMHAPIGLQEDLISVVVDFPNSNVGLRERSEFGHLNLGEFQSTARKGYG